MQSLKEYAALVNRRLESIIPVQPENASVEGQMPELLARSMRYSLLAGGKRLRPSMFLAALDMLGADSAVYLDFACTIEMIHSYSLIHDDLPGMDNDTLRRGRPTSHVVFGEGQAILAGDGLLNFAFETMLQCALAHPENLQGCVEGISEIATGAGVSGMIGGQVIDLYCERSRLNDEAHFSYIQRNKTACMFIYPLRAAARIARADAGTLSAVSRYGEAFGRLFQTTDDLLDVIGDSGEVGKTLGKDAEQGKLTAVSLYGVDGTRDLTARQLDDALTALGELDADTAFFEALARSMIDRTM